MTDAHARLHLDSSIGWQLCKSLYHLDPSLVNFTLSNQWVGYLLGVS